MAAISLPAEAMYKLLAIGKVKIRWAVSLHGRASVPQALNLGHDIHGD